MYLVDSNAFARTTILFKPKICNSELIGKPEIAQRSANADGEKHM